MTVAVGIELNGEIALAADGRSSINDVVVTDLFRKIVSHGDNFHVALAGPASLHALARELVEEHHDPGSFCAALRATMAEREADRIEDRDGNLPAYCVSAAIINEDGVWYVDGELYPQRFEAGQPAAIGSGLEAGRAAALSILSLQAQLAASGIPATISAETVVSHAVKIACAVVSSCGGVVSVASVKKALPENVIPFPANATPTPPERA